VFYLRADPDLVRIGLRLFSGLILAACLPLGHPTASRAAPAALDQTISVRWLPDGPSTSNISNPSNQWMVEARGLSGATMRALRRMGADVPWPKIFPVYAEQGNLSIDAALPPMLGRYTLLKDGVSFRPQYALQPGASYRAVLRADALPGRSTAPSFVGLSLSSSFQLPAARPVSSTVVSGIFPSAGELPENLLKFYVLFSAPMSGGHIYERIHLLNESGPEVELPFLEIDEELWDPTMTRLTLFIDPGRIKRGVTPLEEIGPALENGRRYVLAIDAAWRDAAGAPLQAGFRKSFHVGPANRSPIAVKDWKVQAPSAHTSEALQVRFDRALDWALVRRVINVHQADRPGAKVEGRGQTEDEERQWRFTPSRPWVRGRYELRIQNTLEDLAGNNIGKSFEVDLFEGVDRHVTNSTVRIPFEIR
jgi:hypothetical protein